MMNRRYFRDWELFSVVGTIISVEGVFYQGDYPSNVGDRYTNSCEIFYSVELEDGKVIRALAHTYNINSKYFVHSRTLLRKDVSTITEEFKKNIGKKIAVVEMSDWYKREFRCSDYDKYGGSIKWRMGEHSPMNEGL